MYIIGLPAVGLLAFIAISQWLIYKLRSMDAREVVTHLLTISESLGPSTNGDYLSDMADSLSEIERVALSVGEIAGDMASSLSDVERAMQSVRDTADSIERKMIG